MDKAVKPIFRWAWLLFFFSGFTGLLYEILWTRRLTLVFGHSILAVSTVVTTYMGGLAIGSWFGGRFADGRLRSGWAGGRFVSCYGALEFFVGLWGLLSLHLLDRVESLYYAQSSLGLSGLPLNLLGFGLSALALLPPTIAMGATLPIVGCLFSAEKERIGTQLSRLYGLNTWGAVLGAAGAGYLLLPWLGLKLSVLVAASINAFIGLLGFFLGRSYQEVAPQPEENSPISDGSLTLLPLIFALAGFSSMTFQLGWTRGLALTLGGAVYSFTSILVVFLSGIALGSLLYPRLLGTRQVGWSQLGTVCLGLGVSATLSSLVMGYLPLAFAWILPSVRNNYTMVVLVNLLFCALILLAPTILMGLSFPLVTDIYHRQYGGLGRSIGNIYGANTLGCILGSLGCGFFGLPMLGVQNSLRLAVSLNLLAGLLCFLHTSRRKSGSLLVGTLLVFNWTTPNWGRGILSAGVVLGNLSPTKVLNRPEPYYYSDGLTCSVAAEWPAPDSPCLKVNGKVDASMGLLDRANMMMIGLLPLMYLDDVGRTGVIGLGSGDTLFTISGSRQVREVVCAELESKVLDCVPIWSPYLAAYEKRPNVKLLEADGRTLILGSPGRFDILINEPSNPWIAGIGNLYTQDFYRACRGKLNDPGVYLQWCNLYALSPDDLNMVLRTFFGVFPEGEVWLGGTDLLLMGKTRKLDCRPERIRAYWDENADFRAAMIELGFLDPQEILGQYVCSWDYLKRQIPAGPVNTDDRPLLEYSAPRSLYANHGQRNLETVLDWRRKAAEFPSGIQPDTQQLIKIRLGNAACQSRELAVIPLDAQLPPEFKELFQSFLSARSQNDIPGPQHPLWTKYSGFVRGRLEWARRAAGADFHPQALALLAMGKPDPTQKSELFLYHWLSARSNKQLGRREEALADYLKLMELVPCSVFASEICDCYRLLGDQSNARSWSDRVLSMNPRDTRALLAQGWFAAQTGDPATAEQKIRQSLRICPYYMDAWLELSRVYALSNRLTEVRWALKQGEKLAPNEAVAEQFRTLQSRLSD
ncbi:fused MFS/spermidine synthase [bacterium]|nr:fused MFS/spermidine synthase [bacterium]